jgi:hypothetical protein
LSKPQKTISVDDLPRWSNWPARLLGVEDFASVKRDTAKVHAEYSVDKWQKCLDAFEASGGTMDAQALRRLSYDISLAKPRASVQRGQLVEATNEEIMSAYDQILRDAMAPATADAATVVELGSSFGHIMWMLRKAFPQLIFRGGDYADSAVALAAKLYAGLENISVSKFDFYAPTYDIIENAKGPVIVYTSQALEQIPKSAGVIETLSRYKGKISRVFHLEPAYALYGSDSVLDLMRRRYIELNDYNRDLIPTLTNRSDVEILRQDANIIGWNPFNSLALTEWRFKR